jgi:hypothetical protein
MQFVSGVDRRVVIAIRAAESRGYATYSNEGGAARPPTRGGFLFCLVGQPDSCQTMTQEYVNPKDGNCSVVMTKAARAWMRDHPGYELKSPLQCKEKATLLYRAQRFFHLHRESRLT